MGLNITSDGHVPLSYKLFDGNTTDDVTHIPNWNGLRTLLEKEDFIYVAACKLRSHKNLTHIAQNGGLFITIVPKDRKKVKQFLQQLKSDDLKFKDAYQVESSRKKGKVNIFKTYQADRTDEGFRIIWVHSSSKQDIVIFVRHSQSTKHPIFFCFFRFQFDTEFQNTINYMYPYCICNNRIKNNSWISGSGISSD